MIKVLPIILLLFILSSCFESHAENKQDNKTNTIAEQSLNCSINSNQFQFDSLKKTCDEMSTAKDVSAAVIQVKSPAYEATRLGVKYIHLDKAAKDLQSKCAADQVVGFDFGQINAPQFEDPVDILMFRCVPRKDVKVVCNGTRSSKDYFKGKDPYCELIFHRGNKNPFNSLCEPECHYVYPWSKSYTGSGANWGYDVGYVGSLNRKLIEYTSNNGKPSNVISHYDVLDKEHDELVKPKNKDKLIKRLNSLND